MSHVNVFKGGQINVNGFIHLYFGEKNFLCTFRGYGVQTNISHGFMHRFKSQ